MIVHQAIRASEKSGSHTKIHIKRRGNAAMRIPRMNRNASYRVTIPALSGGLNLQDAPHLVEDDQLTDGENIWWKDQALRSRPGCRLADQTTLVQTGMSSLLDAQRADAVLELTINGEPLTGLVFFTTNEYSTVQSTVQLICLAADGTIHSQGQRLFEAEMAGGGIPHGGFFIAESPAAAGSAGGSQPNSRVLAYLDNGQIYRFTYQSDESWTAAQVTDLYIPTLLVSGRGFSNEDYFTQPGALYESRNLLTGAFRASFTTDGAAMTFPLPLSGLSSNEGETVTVALTQDEGGAAVTYTFTIPPDSSESSLTLTITGQNNESYTVHAYIDRELGQVSFCNIRVGESGQPYYITPVPFQSNNLTVTAWKTEPEQLDRIVSMRFGTWFGGDRSGLSGGTRLFVAGHPDYPNRVHWSDINRPLYFPANNYAVVGEAAQRVTAFGKQADMLVIFKERELYAATYAARTVSAEELQSGAVVDMTAATAYFPITQLHGSIGCDCPQTVQLCNNRLIWATSEGRVYGLGSSSAYSDRNVSAISLPIDPALASCGPAALRNACAARLDPYYVLAVGDQLLLCDTLSAGFASALSGSGSRAARTIPWYRWEWPVGTVQITHLLGAGRTLQAVGILRQMFSDGQGKTQLFSYSLDGETDSRIGTWEDKNQPAPVIQAPVHTVFETKRFDCGRPERLKTIRRLFLGATDTGDRTVRLSYRTERGLRSDAYRLGRTGSGRRREWAVTPGLARVEQFGLRVESDGPLAVDGLVLRYEVGGEI